jgi:hypothetical protein
MKNWQLIYQLKLSIYKNSEFLLKEKFMCCRLVIQAYYICLHWGGMR